MLLFLHVWFQIRILRKCQRGKRHQTEKKQNVCHIHFGWGIALDSISVLNLQICEIWDYDNKYLAIFLVVFF